MKSAGNVHEHVSNIRLISHVPHGKFFERVDWLQARKYQVIPIADIFTYVVTKRKQ